MRGAEAEFADVSSRGQPVRSYTRSAPWCCQLMPCWNPACGCWSWLRAG